MKRAGDPSKAPPAKRQSGFNLDHALSSISQLHAPLSTRGPSAPPLESDETASPYLISKASTATMWPTSSSNSPALAVCRNPQCGRSDFEVDARRGERTCTHCGAVQNTRSLESQEEEHRTFADDDKSESKKRAEVSRDGQGGGAAGPKELQRTMQLANASAERPGELTQKDHERVQKYKKAISELAIALGITEHSAAVDESMHLALTYVESVLAHKQCCKELDKCRLSKTHNAELIAAGLLRMGMIKNSLNRQLAQFAAALNKMGKEATASTVYAACDLVKSHISSFSEDKAYPCSDNKRTILAEGEEDVAAAVTKYTSLLPRICKRLNLPYYVQNRASELIEGWHQQGLPSLQTTTVAACAIVIAHEELVPVLKELVQAVTVNHDMLCKVMQIEKNTLQNGLKKLRAQLHVPSRSYPIKPTKKNVQPDEGNTVQPDEQNNVQPDEKQI